MSIYTKYSEDIPGDDGNYNRAVRFDLCGGYVGITERSEPFDRVLISPRQFAALIAFAAPPARRRSTKPAAKKARR